MAAEEATSAKEEEQIPDDELCIVCQERRIVGGFVHAGR